MFELRFLNFIVKPKHLYTIISTNIKTNCLINKKTIKNNSIMVKIQKLPSGQLVITIPKVLAEYEGLEKGSEIEFKKHKEGFILEIKKKKI
jgi:hypothetical protein|tara:strand:- start:259 stop:531 length:273 start_codon:yes stop_codon:yes gene_type:complete